MTTLKGVIPALTTPFRDDQSLDLPAFERLIDGVIDDGVHGLLVGGCTGESWALDDDERQALFRTAVQRTRGRVPVIVGCGAMLARQAIAKVRQAEAAGCDAVMIQPPSYVMPSLDEVHDYYIEIARASRLPLVVYNIPRRTGIHFDAEFVSRLADVPNVIAVKESSKDFLVLSRIIRAVGDRLAVFAGYAALLGLAALTEGAVGYMDSTTPIVGRRSVDFFNASITGDVETARRLQKQFADASAGLSGIGTFPAAVKAALDLIGRPGGRTRDPIRPLSADQRARVQRVLIETGLQPAQAVNA